MIYKNIFFLLASINYILPGGETENTEEENFAELLKEHKEFSYILYTTEKLHTLEKMDREGNKIPFIIFIIVSNNKNSRYLCTGTLIKELSQELNNTFSTYEDLNDHNCTGAITLFFIIHEELKEFDRELTTLLNTFPFILTTPTILSICRKKSCSNNLCRKKNNFALLKEYLDIQFPVFLWKEKILNDLLNIFLSHGFQKPKN
jgi:hypothetical protein